LGDDDNGEYSGSVHVFARSGEDWIHQDKLLSPEGAAEDEFGESVAIFEDAIVLGAQYDQDNGANSGSAHVFVRSGEIWTHQAKLLAPDGVSGDLFGDSVAIYEDKVVLGAYLDDDKGGDSGSAYVFHRRGETWTYQAKLLAQDGSELDSFGCSVATYGDSIVVGAIGDDHNDNGDASGSAYVFQATLWICAADPWNANVSSMIKIMPRQPIFSKQCPSSFIRRIPNFASA